MGRISIPGVLRPLSEWATGKVRAPLNGAPSKTSEAERQAEARRSLLLQFESLGENCELGFVQEHLDAYPISLFRWSGISLDSLLTALDTDLDGIGEADFTDIRCDESTGEYFFRDVRYGMNTHTRMFRRDHSVEEVRRLLLVRTRRLREKLIEDLQEGRKVFVFQSAATLSDEERHRLFAAVRRLGPSAELLCLSPTADARRIGRVRRMAPGLMIGWLDRVGFDGRDWRISYQLWLTLLAEASRLCGRKTPKDATASVAGLNPFYSA